MKDEVVSTVRLDSGLHKAIRIAAIEDRISMNDALNEGAKLWLKERHKKGKK